MKKKNAETYRKPNFDKTISSHTKDVDLDGSYSLVQPKKRVNQIRRDKDDVKDPQITLYDVDYAVKYYLENIVRPTIIENGQEIRVPVFYASGERWSSIQAHGYMRDSKNKALSPAISIKRTTVAHSTERVKSDTGPDDITKLTFQKKYSKTNYYDNFSVLNRQEPKKELFYVEMPEYVDVDYDVQMWTSFNEHLNKIVESIIHFEGHAFGDPNSYKFITTADTYSFETINTVGEDRLVTANASLKTKAYLIPKDSKKEEIIKRGLTIGKIKFEENIF